MLSVECVSRRGHHNPPCFLAFRVPCRSPPQTPLHPDTPSLTLLAIDRAQTRTHTACPPAYLPPPITLTPLPGRVTAFVADITQDVGPGRLAARLPGACVDYCCMVFVLSAVAPQHMRAVREREGGLGRVLGEGAAAVWAAP